MLALTDGVYAIIITLLVLDIHVPKLEAHETLRSALYDVRPSFVSFIICFIVAAMNWVGHRDLFTLIRDTDRGIVWLNLLTLFAACLLPFGSALLSSYHQDVVALHMFGLILMATSLTRTIIWLYATLRPSVVHDPLDRASFWSGLALSVFQLAIYVTAFAIAGVSTGPAWPSTPRHRCCTSSPSRCYAGWLPAARPNASSPSAGRSRG